MIRRTAKFDLPTRPDGSESRRDCCWVERCRHPDSEAKPPARKAVIDRFSERRSIWNLQSVNRHPRMEGITHPVWLSLVAFGANRPRPGPAALARCRRAERLLGDPALVVCVQIEESPTGRRWRAGCQEEPSKRATKIRLTSPLIRVPALPTGRCIDVAGAARLSRTRRYVNVDLGFGIESIDDLPDFQFG
jgi:hypothetical protein